MQEIMTVTPGIGQTRMIGALHSRGIRVPRWKVRELMRWIQLEQHFGGEELFVEESTMYEVQMHCGTSMGTIR